MGNASSKLSSLTQGDANKQVQSQNETSSNDEEVHHEQKPKEKPGHWGLQQRDKMTPRQTKEQDREKLANAAAQTSRVRKRHKRRARQSRRSPGSLPDRFSDLPIELKTALKKTYGIYDDESNNKEMETGEREVALARATLARAGTYVLKRSHVRYRRSGRLSRYREAKVLSTHYCAWDANLALLDLLPDICGLQRREASSGKAGRARSCVYWNINDEDGCLEAGFATGGSGTGSDGEDNENEKLYWQGWIVEKETDSESA